MGVCEVLIDLALATNDTSYLEPLAKAFEWYDTHRLPNGKYARLYEPGTQRPVYGRRDKAVKVYDFAEACTGYGWQGDWYPKAAKAAYEAIQRDGLDAYRKQRATPAPAPSVDALESRAAAALQDLTESGEWLDAPSGREPDDLKAEGLPGDTRW